MSDPTPTPAPTPTPEPTPTPAPTPAPAWHGLTEAADIQFVENKGWKTAADMFRSYRGAEQLIGKDPSTLMPLPRMDDPASVRGVLSKLGLPESPDKYEFGYSKDTPIDENYAKWARDAFHKVGITGPMAKELTAAHETYIKGVMAQQETDYNLSVEADKKALQKEWGAGYERMLGMTKHAANALGFDNAVIDAIEQTKGFAATMKMFADLGKKLGEPSFVSPEGKAAGFGGAMTPDEAKAEWDRMKADENTVKALNDAFHPNNSAMREKQKKLFGIMYPEG